jgi:hypothetical protein
LGGTGMGAAYNVYMPPQPVLPPMLFQVSIQFIFYLFASASIIASMNSVNCHFFDFSITTVCLFIVSSQYSDATLILSSGRFYQFLA